jgi:tRNA A37 methylthiotransferase MiaB
MASTNDIVQKLWNLCHVLRDDGVTYHQYVTELTYLLFLKMAKETGIARLRVAYLQPAEVRPSLLAALAAVPVVAGYYDLSFQHASASVLRRMRRFGGTQDFLGLIDSVRARDPEAGIRSNVIVGFPGETAEEFAELLSFLESSRLDAIGVFGYSDEDGTEAATLDDKIDQEEVDRRVRVSTALAEEVMAQRAEDRVGSTTQVLIEELTHEGAVGRAGHQGPDDGSTLVLRCTEPVGSIVTVQIVDTEGVDLIAEYRG